MRLPSLPSWLVAACAAVVLLAVVSFAVTGERDADVSAAPGQAPTQQQRTPDRTTQPPDQHPGKHSGTGDGHGQGQQLPQRRTASVTVFNNSGVTGLAASTAATLQDAGWRVVGTDNWYGEIPADTVYFAPGDKAQARLLAQDLGVTRLHAAVSGMSFDRLTVILVG